MKNLRAFSVIFVLFLSSGLLFAQETDVSETDPAKEREKQRAALINSIISDANELRLRENRIFVASQIGDQIWGTDKERAMALFQYAVDEFIQEKMLIDADRDLNRRSQPHIIMNIRAQVLRVIARRDAAFALDAFYRTRPSAVEKALARQSSNDPGRLGPAALDRSFAYNEIALEQSLIQMAADQDPEKAIAMLEAALKKGVGPGTLQLLQKLHQKDPESAEKFGKEAIDQLLRSDPGTGPNSDITVIQTSLSFLNDHIRQRSENDKSLRFPDRQINALLDKLITHFLADEHFNQPWLIQNLINIAEKMRRDAVNRLRELEKRSATLTSRRSQDPQVLELTRGDLSVEEILARASRMPAESQSQVYLNVIGRLAASGDLARARQIMNDNFSGDALENARNNINSSYANHLINQGKYAEAEALVDELPEIQQFASLISLAENVYNRDRENNKPHAVRLLERVQSSMSSHPENSSEMQQTMALISAYTQIEPDIAFRMFASLIPHINELTEAAAIIYTFRRNGTVKQGEFLMGGYGSFTEYINPNVIVNIGKNDIEQALDLVDSLSRREIRVIIKMQLLTQAIPSTGAR